MTDGNNNIAGDALLSFIQRIERLEDERRDLGADIREVYREVKGMGFDAKIVRKLVALRKQEASDRQEEQALIESYAASIGLLL